MKSLFSLSVYFKKYWVRLLLGFIFVGLANYFAVSSIVCIRKGIDYLEKLPRPFAENEVHLKLLGFVGLTILFSLTQGFFMFMMRQTIIVMSRHIEFDQKNDIYQKFLGMDFSSFRNQRTGDLINKLGEDVSRVRMFTGPSLMYLANTIMTFVFTLGIMMRVNFSLTLIVLSTLPLLAISIFFVSGLMNKNGTLVQEQLSTISTKVQETFSGIRLIKALGVEQYFQENFDGACKEFKKRNLNQVMVDSMFQPFVIILIGLSNIFVLYFGGKLVISGQVSVGNIAEFIVYVNRLSWPVASLGWVTSLMQRAAASQTRINNLLSEQGSTGNSKMGTGVHIKAIDTIEFVNVSFGYEGSKKLVLKQISFQLSKGDAFGIMGKTGSGKTTIANLLTGLIQPTAGVILVNGLPMSEIDLVSYRQLLGYVPQDVFLFSDTIQKNTSFGLIEGPQTKEVESVEKALAAASILESVNAFPLQLQTMIGERGVLLSGGQKQRISIARALIKQPQLLLLDDALSAVDTTTEKAILQNISNTKQNGITVFISHRLSVVAQMEKTIVVDQGEIVQGGTDFDLLKI